MNIKPSQTKSWDDIDQSKANIQCTGGRPELYNWYKKDDVFFAHRKPSIHEMHENEFHRF